MKKLNVAVIGLGHLGTKHARVYTELQDHVNIVGICDHNEKNGREIATQHNLPFFEDYRDLVGRVDAVNICTPTTTHHEIAKFFLENDIHTLVEKPISVTVEEADELVALADRKNLKLQIGHVERFNSAFQAIKDIARNPVFVEIHRLNNFPNRSLDVGVVLDLMIHDIDIINGLMDSAIKDVQAVGINVLTKREDIANVRLTFENGTVCNITASRISPEVTRKIRIFLPNTYISLDYVKQEAFMYKKQLLRIAKKALPIEQQEPLKKEILSFIDCIEHDKTPVVSGIEGRDALRIALQITEKIWDAHKNKITV